MDRDKDGSLTLHELTEHYAYDPNAHGEPVEVGNGMMPDKEV